MTPGEEGTRLPTTQRGSIHNPNLWAQRPMALSSFLLPTRYPFLTCYLSFLEIGREPGPSAFRRLTFLLTGSDFWGVEQDRQLTKDPFPVILDFPTMAILLPRR